MSFLMVLVSFENLYYFMTSEQVSSAVRHLAHIIGQAAQNATDHQLHCFKSFELYFLRLIQGQYPKNEVCFLQHPPKY
jgi:hypothetical protein